MSLNAGRRVFLDGFAYARPYRPALEELLDSAHAQGLGCFESASLRTSAVAIQHHCPVKPDTRGCFRAAKLASPFLDLIGG
jgi:hypothetical protein